jgi:hypothetical protein
MAQANLSFPDFTVPEAKKDEEWYKQCVTAIVKSTLTSKYDFNYRTITECMDFFNGTHSGDEFQFLQTSEDGDVLPAKWIPFNKIRVKVDLLLGELNRKQYEVSVRALNKEASVRRTQKRNELYSKMRLKPVTQGLEQQFGLPLQDGSPVPDDESGVDDFMKFSYKEKSEIVMEAALKYLCQRHSWNYERIALFRDILIAGRCFVKNEVCEGLPYFRRIDPRNIVFDPDATNDFLTDATYVGEVRYMGIAECAERYNLKQSDIMDVYNKYRGLQNSLGSVANSSNAAFASLVDGVKNVQLFNNDTGSLRVLVYSAEWMDTKILAYKKSKDSYGGDHFKKVKDTYKGDDAKKTTIKVVRKATLIGGDMIVDWGEAKNQVRNVDHLYDTKLSYTCLVPNYINGRGISKVEQMASLQKLKDITMYNVQLAMSRAGTKGFIYDVSQCPDDWDPATVIKYLRTVGVAFIDSKKDGIQSQYNQFGTFDQTLSQSVEQYINISRMIDGEMDAISGINEARQGIVQSSSQAVGVTQSALMQSNLSTETLFEFFSQFAGKMFTYQACLVKITFVDKDKYASIIGEAGVDFLREDIQLDLDDYGVAVEALPPILEDKQKFEGLITSALQTSSIDFLDAVKLLQEKDLKLAIRMFEKSLQKKQAVMQQQQAQQQQAEQQAAMQQQQAASQSAMQQQQMTEASKAGQQQAANQSAQQIQQMKNHNDLHRDLLKGRMDQINQQNATVKK